MDTYTCVCGEELALYQLIRVAAGPNVIYLCPTCHGEVEVTEP